MNFERQIRNTRNIPMTPLIDVVFLLLIFFMLSTSFVRTESLELLLPQGNAVSSGESKVLQVYVTGEGFMYIGRTPVNEEKLIATLKHILKQQPDLNILLLSGAGVNVQQLVKVMDRIYLAGGKNLSVASWEPRKDRAHD